MMGVGGTPEGGADLVYPLRNIAMPQPGGFYGLNATTKDGVPNRLEEGI